MNRNFVQIGIGDTIETAEFSYLAQTNWFEIMKSLPIWKQLPKELYDFNDKRPWKYLGIERNPSFVEMLKQQASHKEKYICANVGSKFPFYYKNKSLITLKELFRKCNIAEVDGLAIDIEFFEYPVLEEYDWGIKPKYIVVEAHGSYFFENGCTEILPRSEINLDRLEPRAANLVDILKRQGYEIYDAWFTNWPTEEPMIRELDLHFLLT